MDARILGPLEMYVEGQRIEIRGGKQRELLAVLLVNANEIVSPDRLIDDLWGASPPPTAAKTLQAHVSRLRTALGSSSDALETHGHGFRLRLGSGELDAETFRSSAGGRPSCARARRGRRSHPRRCARPLRSGAVPRYPSSGTRTSPRPRSRGWRQLRLSAQEERIDADLRARAPRRAHRRARGAGRGAPAPGTATRTADAHAVSVGQAGGGAPDVSGGSASARRGARPRAEREPPASSSAASSSTTPSLPRPSGLPGHASCPPRRGGTRGGSCL